MPVSFPVNPPEKKLEKRSSLHCSNAKQCSKENKQGNAVMKGGLSCKFYCFPPCNREIPATAFIIVFPCLFPFLPCSSVAMEFFKILLLRGGRSMMMFFGAYTNYHIYIFFSPKEKI